MVSKSGVLEIFKQQNLQSRSLVLPGDGAGKGESIGVGERKGACR